ncbi:MAG TPA: hypothetical protein HPP83_02225, partial [Candidatus Hydrogenedentes bacterium]|nr:hypothetical protein [Candidatus Hydrogenedentota bacterium]
MGHGCDTSQDAADRTTDPVDAEAVRFTKNWHRHRAFHDALWCRGVNLGETDEYLLFPEVLGALIDQEKRGVSPIAATPKDRAEWPRDQPQETFEGIPACDADSARYPELEAALAEGVPENAKSLLVLGGAAARVAEAVRSAHPEADVIADGFSGLAPCGPADAVVIADPLPHTSVAEALLRDARERVR